MTMGVLLPYPPMPVNARSSCVCVNDTGNRINGPGGPLTLSPATPSIASVDVARVSDIWSLESGGLDRGGGEEGGGGEGAVETSDDRQDQPRMIDGSPPPDCLFWCGCVYFER